MSVSAKNVALENQQNSKQCYTTCPYCGVGCGVEATIENNHILKVKGRTDHPSNFGRLCVKGSSLAETQGQHQRVLTPKIDGEAVSWQAATDHVAQHFLETIEKHGKDSVAFYLSGQLLTEDYYVANKLMKGFIGSGNVDTNSRLCMASASTAHKRAFGEDIVPGNYQDLESAEVIFFIGSNAAYAHPVVYQRIISSKAKNPNVKLVVIDPRKSATANDADLHLAIKPGTDAYFYNGLLNYLYDNDAVDNAYIKAHCQGFEAALEASQRQIKTIEDVALACDIAVDLLQESYQLFAAHRNVVSFFSQGVNQSSTGVDKGNAIINCHLASGKIGYQGAGAFSITGQPNAMGGREVGGLANQLAAHMHFESTNEIDIVKRFWQAPNIATKQGLKAVDMFNGVERGDIKAIWIVATNPVVSMPNADLVKRALEKCPMVVVSECYENADTLSYADVIFPATTWGEKHGSVTNSERTISVQQPMLIPPGMAKNDWQIFCDVAKAMGYQHAFDYTHPVEIFREHAGLSAFENSRPTQAQPKSKYRVFNLDGLKNITLAQYENFSPIKWPVTEQHPKGCERLFTQGNFAFDDGKARLVPITAKLPQKRAQNDQVIMNTGRIRDQWHTMTRTGRVAKLMTHFSEPFIEISVHDALRFNVEDKQLARLNNLDANFIGRVHITDKQRKGEVFVPIHWNDHHSVSARAGALVNPITDKYCGQPEFKHSPVNIDAFEVKWAGYLLTSHALSLSFDYWTKVQREQCIKYIIADNTELADVEQELAFLFPAIDDWLVLKDSNQNLLRIAGFNDKSLSCFFIASDDLTQSFSSQYIESQFGKIHELRSRFKLLAGKGSDGSHDVGEIICSCFQVGEIPIKQAIESGQCKNVEQLSKALKCGSNCGSCIPELKNFFSQ